MLQKIRDSLQSQRWLAIVVLGALALVFAAWGAYGIVNINVGVGDYAAKVGSEKLSLQQVREDWMREQSQWQQRYGAEIPPDIKASVQNSLLESLISNLAMTQRAHDLGYRVSSAQIQEAIRSEPAFQIDGQYSPQAARMRLAQAGISLSAFEEQSRASLERQQIEGPLRASNFLTPGEIEHLRALANQEREVRYALLTPAKFQGTAPVDEAAIAAYYSSHQAQFLTPEWTKLEYGELRLDQLAAQITVSESDLRDYYEKSKDKYVVPEKRRASHILIQIPAGKDGDAIARKKAEDVLAEARAGKDFAALAKQYSQDVGSAAKGGDLGWVERSSLVGLGDALFNAPVGEIRGPVKTQFGYHLIRVNEIQAGKTQTFDQARTEVEAQLRRDRAADRFGDRQEQLQRRLEQPGADFDAVAKEFQLQTGEVARFLRGTGGAPLGTSNELQDAVFSTAVLDEGRIGGPVLLGEDRIVIVKSLEHHKAAPQPLAEVHEVIIAAILKARGSAAALKAAEEAREKLSGGASFDEVVHELGVTAEPAHFVGRTDPSIPAQIREAVFRAPKPEGKPVYRAVPLSEGGSALVAVNRLRTRGDTVDAQADAAAAEKARTREAEGEVAAYVDEVRRTTDVKKNPKAFE
ncbi:MAG TPA: SurA N-terminal domain-containing protein [Steroidobacteraceae bacterium]|jgi:peptidyl-prolyl cis-trans isomerase D|nr:SurA N-terminal domain-containing protein [Steroidobacteraceae bacterium]